MSQSDRDLAEAAFHAGWEFGQYEAQLGLRPRSMPPEDDRPDFDTWWAERERT